jgi:O-succinylbenzoic acid--CoA ligase
MQLVRSFISGGKIRFDVETVAGSCLSFVPTQLQRALADPSEIARLREARVIFLGGAPLSEACAAEARAQALPVMPVYGMTETAAMCAAVPIRDFLERPGAGALPIGETRIGLDPGGRIRIHSPALFSGYHGQRPLDRSAGYLSDDLGQWDAEGRLRVLGRVDRLIITGGEKVDPAEVERALIALPEVAAARVFGQTDAEWGQVVSAQLVLTQPISDDTIKRRLGQLLSPHKLPKRIERVAQLPQKAI